MFRCTECHKEYEVCPEYCDCGNDVFEPIETMQQQSYSEEYYEPEVRKPVKQPKKKLTKEEIEEIEADKKDKKKALIAICVSFFVCIVILVAPPHMAKKSDKVVKEITADYSKIPDVATYWDNTLPAAFRKSGSENNLPLLNTKLGNIPTSLRRYLQDIGEDFSEQWNPNIIEGEGECSIQFTINRDGILNNSKIVSKSRNESLDDSVLLVLSKITSVDIPPESYKGERIIITFKINEDGSHKIYFPVKNN